MIIHLDKQFNWMKNYGRLNFKCNNFSHAMLCKCGLS